MKNLFIILAVIVFSSGAIAQNNQFRPEAENRSSRSSSANLSIPPELIDLNNSAVQKSLKGKFEEAIIDFREIIAKVPHATQTRYNLGQALIRTGKFDEAIEVFKKLTEENPFYGAPYSGLGEAYYQKQMLTESIEYYNKAIKYCPTDSLTYANSENSLKGFNEFQLQSDLVIAYNNRGSAYFLLGQKKKAIADYRQAISLSPLFAEPYNNLGVILREMGKKDEAHKMFSEAVHLRPHWNHALFNLVLSYIERGERDTARNQLDILANYDAKLAEEGRKILWQKYVVDASSLQPK